MNAPCSKVSAIRTASTHPGGTAAHAPKDMSWTTMAFHVQVHRSLETTSNNEKKKTRWRHFSSSSNPSKGKVGSQCLETKTTQRACLSCWYLAKFIVISKQNATDFILKELRHRWCILKKIFISNPFQSSPPSAILVPFCSRITPLVFFFLSKPLFLGFPAL